MATRKESVFFPALLPSNINSFEYYIKGIPPFPELLFQLKQQGFFVDHSPIDYSMEDFLNTAELSDIDCSSLQLLTKPFPADILLESMTCSNGYPEAFNQIAKEIDLYISMICDVLDNELAKKPYETLRDQENVTEKEHALQAGKISLFLSMDLGDILALLFHDIARPSINDALHGHANHSTEGGIILAPLGLPIDFSRYHTFAKYLLHNYCLPYKGLISDASQYTLSIQKLNFTSDIFELNKLNTKDLAFVLYKLMFMRLIDDMSKVPGLDLKKEQSGVDAEYFSPALIESMLKTQIKNHLVYLVETSVDMDNTILLITEKLDLALSLLSRAEAYSSHPELYAQYKDYAQEALEREFMSILS